MARHPALRNGTVPTRAPKPVPPRPVGTALPALTRAGQAVADGRLQGLGEPRHTFINFPGADSERWLNRAAQLIPPVRPWDWRENHAVYGDLTVPGRAAFVIAGGHDRDGEPRHDILTVTVGERTAHQWSRLPDAWAATDPLLTAINGTLILVAAGRAGQLPPGATSWQPLPTPPNTIGRLLAADNHHTLILVDDTGATRMLRAGSGRWEPAGQLTLPAKVRTRHEGGTVIVSGDGQPDQVWSGTGWGTLPAGRPALPRSDR